MTSVDVNTDNRRNNDLSDMGCLLFCFSLAIFLAGSMLWFISCGEGDVKI